MARGWIIAFAALAAGGCTGNIGGSDRLETASAELYAAAAWKQKKISVCWENPTPANAQEREWVRKRIEGSWDHVAGIDFVWLACKEKSKGIRIRSADAHPHVKTIGRYLDGVPNGMVLNFTFEKWGKACHDRREYCIKAGAVHEFGHALGFWHEQDRPDNPAFCKDHVMSENMGITTGPYDLHSVMNYCNPSWCNHGKLSKLDIKGVRKIYGADGVEALPDGPFDGPPANALEPLSNDVLDFALPENDDGEPSCVDECSPDDTACLDDDRLVACADLDSDGCLEWGQELSCGASAAGTMCVDGSCEAGAPPPGCAQGEKQCIDGDRFIECSGGAWSAPYGCAQSFPGTVCNGGYCVGCSVPGEKRCVNDDAYVECNGASWSGAYSCAGSWPGTVCKSGYCVNP